MIKKLSKTKGLFIRCLSRPQQNFSSSQNQSNENAESNFGYQKVNINDKQNMVNGVFHSVASKYDVMNDVMSLGIHRCWKDYFVNEVGLIRPSKVYQENNTVKEIPAHVLDVAGGTGDIAFRIIDKHRENRSYLGDPGLKITCLDINNSMLEEGRKRAKGLGYSENELTFVEGDAEKLDFPDNTFDLYTISFGLRNVPRTEKALSEAYRVLKKGGRFMCLEFSKVTVFPFDQVYKFYNFNLLPIMGQVIASDSASYQYLAESIDKFYDQKTLLKLLENAGFQYASYKDLSLGICAIHSGFKL